MATASAMDLSSLEKDPRLFLYTSLTAGSSHIITATSRLETILKANRIPFQAIDTATDEKARRLWQRRAGKRKLPGLVKEGYVVGDLEEVEEWNEFGELKENIGPVPANNAAPAGGQTGINIAPVSPYANKPASAAATSNQPAPPLAVAAGAPSKTAPANKPAEAGFDRSKGIALPGAAEIAARNLAKSSSTTEALNIDTSSSAPREKATTISFAADTAPPKNVSSEPTSRTPAKETEKPASQISGANLKAAGAPVTPNNGSTSTDPSTSEAAAASESNVKHDSNTTTTAQVKVASAVSEAAGSKQPESEVENAQTDQFEKVEHETALPESSKEDEASGATKGLEAVKLDEGVAKTHEEDAAKGVEE